MLLRFRVFEQTISAYPTKSEPRRGSVEYLQLQFLFSDDWKDMNKVLYFQSGEFSTPVELESDIVTVPEFYTEQTSFNITLFGKNGDVEIPTNVVEILLLESNNLWISDAPVPEPSWLLNMKELNDHPPTPGSNGYWLIWNVETGQYEPSDIPLPSGGGGGMNYQIGHGLKVREGYILEVDTTDNVEADNTLPITASAVFQTVGNIEILLGTI